MPETTVRLLRMPEQLAAASMKDLWQIRDASQSVLVFLESALR